LPRRDARASPACTGGEIATVWAKLSHEVPKMSASPINPARLQRLAEVGVRVGLNLQPGQDLVLTAPLSAAPLVRLIAAEAYKAGAGLVTPIYGDEEVTLARYRNAKDETFERAADWLYEGMAKAYNANAARMAIVGDNPMLLSGEDA